MRVLVCGGRKYRDKERLYGVLDKLHEGTKIDRIVCGGASGADLLAERWARERGVSLRVYKPDWDTYGLRAGPIRNKKMLDEEDPDLVVAFPGGGGTRDMVTRSFKEGLPVMEISDDA